MVRKNEPVKEIQVKTQIELKDLKIKIMEVPIVGISPLIVHKFSAKITKEMEAKQQGKAKSAKHDIRNPENEFQEAKHVSPKGWEGFPSGGFKKAIVRGAKAVGLVMTDIRAGVFLEADCEETNLVRINGSSKMRTDHVRIGNGSADIRYRPEYVKWDAILKISFNEGLVSKEQVLQAIYAAGYGTGIGDWRPEKGGEYGRFTIPGM